MVQLKQQNLKIEKDVYGQISIDQKCYKKQKVRRHQIVKTLEIKIKNLLNVIINKDNNDNIIKLSTHNSKQNLNYKKEKLAQFQNQKLQNNFSENCYQNRKKSTNNIIKIQPCFISEQKNKFYQNKLKQGQNNKQLKLKNNEKIQENFFLFKNNFDNSYKQETYQKYYQPQHQEGHFKQHRNQFKSQQSVHNHIPIINSQNCLQPYQSKIYLDQSGQFIYKQLQFDHRNSIKPSKFQQKSYKKTQKKDKFSSISIRSIKLQQADFKQNDIPKKQDQIKKIQIRSQLAKHVLKNNLKYSEIKEKFKMTVREDFSNHYQLIIRQGFKAFKRNNIFRNKLIKQQQKFQAIKDRRLTKWLYSVMCESDEALKVLRNVVLKCYLNLIHSEKPEKFTSYEIENVYTFYRDNYKRIQKQKKFK